jgi:hypothetical protein
MVETRNERNRSVIGAVAVVLLLATYLFVPYALYIPVDVAVGREWISYETLATFSRLFAPVAFVRTRIPLYNQMLEAEWWFFLTHGYHPVSTFDPMDPMDP